MSEKQELDYEKLGMKSGLEIHQQLDTGKLFCSCPGVLRRDEPDYEIMRKLHAVAGESGKIDAAAKHEASLDKNFIYQGYNDTICLVELDEEPPHEINKEALKIALQVAIFLNAKIMPITQIMRKTVIDGSNTSGFQRTVLIAKDGYVETKYGRVGIDTICLEEDAARIIEKRKNEVVYRLDRLGIPLVEIATKPDIKNPEQAKEVALFLGDVLRSCKVKRGLGTIRQDVNVSISKGARTEIKGVQEPELIIKAINSEIKRQKNLIKENKKINSEVRKVLETGETEFLRPMPGSARMYPETDLPLLKISRDLINETKKSLPELRKNIQKQLEKQGLHKEMVKLLFKKNKIDEYKTLLDVFDNPKIVAKILLIFPREIASHKKISLERIDEILTEDILIFILEALKNKKISESQVKEVLEKIVSGEKPEKAIEFDKQDFAGIEEEIMKIIKSKPGLSDKAYMGLVMQKFKGKISGKEAIDIIQKFLK
ncbi:Glu-tRNA(Gln) amidotransferase subunit GatE [Candidatus Pacearchaeota archaeon]|nr:Glu-tRNA(Gln) amidotransferase subunit GatE [Candidatus Pacearchaeota archaeon]